MNDDRYLIISYRELENYKHSKFFLWDCYCRFRATTKLSDRFNDNIVMMYESDFNKLREKEMK